MTKSQEPKEEKSTIEKLRDELFSYRVDIKSYIRSLNIIIIAGTIIISILAFFGYNKIENIEKIVLDKANQRLAITDSLLSKIDQKKIDSLNQLLKEKEKEFSFTIMNFEKIITQNKELELKLLTSLPENERLADHNPTYSTESPTNYFYLYPFKKKLKIGEVEFIYLVFRTNIEFTKDDFISLRLYPSQRQILVLQKDYKINTKFNKLSFGVEKFGNYKNYKIEIGLFKKEKGGYKFFYLTENIELI